MIFDTHAHYDDSQFNDDRDAILMSLQKRGVSVVVNVSSDVPSWDRVMELTRSYEFMYGAIGVHPDEIGALNEADMERMERLIGDSKIVAVGEIGLDYYWDRESRSEQERWFCRQMDMAERLHKPVIIHSREAAADTMEIVRRYAGAVSGVIHCYSYETQQAQEYVDMGYMLGVGGVVTFKNSRKLKDVVEHVPLSSIVLETDCPYLAPVPYRGKRNDSGYLSFVAETVAQIKQCDVNEVIRVTAQNARKLYRLDRE